MVPSGPRRPEVAPSGPKWPAVTKDARLPRLAAAYVCHPSAAPGIMLITCGIYLSAWKTISLATSGRSRSLSARYHEPIIPACKCYEFKLSPPCVPRRVFDYGRGAGAVRTRPPCLLRGVTPIDSQRPEYQLEIHTNICSADLILINANLCQLTFYGCYKP